MHEIVEIDKGSWKDIIDIYSILTNEIKASVKARKQDKPDAVYTSIALSREVSVATQQITDRLYGRTRAIKWPENLRDEILKTVYSKYNDAVADYMELVTGLDERLFPSFFSLHNV